MARLFVALKIPENVLEKVLNYCYIAAENPVRFKWETIDKIHLTLKFIGEVDDNLVKPISDELEFLQGYSSFDCNISRFGFFFRNSIPKILWCDLNTEKPLMPIVSELNERMEKFGIKSEKRKFRAHLTLLRIKKDVSEKFIQRVKSFQFDEIHFTANKISLVKSTLSKQGASYKDLKIFELK
jgi:2'-5' RNA ligase